MENQKDILIKEAFNNVKKDINNIKENNSILRETLIVILKELREIKETINSQPYNNLTESQPVSQQTNNKFPLKSIEKSVLRKIDKSQVMSAIKNHLVEGHKTTYIKDEVISRFKIKKACFYNYLKLVREQIPKVV